METYDYRAFCSKYPSSIIGIINAYLYYGDEGERMVAFKDTEGGWGGVKPLVYITNDKYELPSKLKARYYSDLERKSYEIDYDFDKVKTEELWKKQAEDFPNSPFNKVCIGFAPYGRVALWLRSDVNQILMEMLDADEVEMSEREHAVYDGHEKYDQATAEKIKKEFKADMRQYPYRYVALEEYFDGKRWREYNSEDERYEAVDFVGVEDKRTDGTFDFTDGANVLRYHEASIPERITVKWNEDGYEYLAHFWIDTYYLHKYFEGFFEVFPDGKADLLLRIDTRANRYEVAMTGKDLAARPLIGTQYIVLRDLRKIALSDGFFRGEDSWPW